LIGFTYSAARETMTKIGRWKDEDFLHYSKNRKSGHFLWRYAYRHLFSQV